MIVIDSENINWCLLEELNYGRAYSGSKDIKIGNIKIISVNDEEDVHVDDKFCVNFTGYDLQEVVQKLLPHIGKSNEEIQKIFLGKVYK